MFKVVISRLRGCALQWWKSYKFKRRKKGKERVRTWKKFRSKLRVACCPSIYILKHVPPLPKKNGSKSSCMNVYIKEGSSNHSPPTPSTPQKIQTLQINLPPQIKPKPIPKNIPRCKCQGFGHTSADCSTRRVITLTEL